MEHTTEHEAEQKAKSGGDKGQPLTLASLLLRNAPASPPAGAGRVHRIGDEVEMPAQADRFREYVGLIRVETLSTNSIARRLSFQIEANALKADLRELVDRGMIAAISNGGTTHYYFLRNKQEVTF